jgi:catechol 2,3-dioxygenase-like lactoylglutathione lyase family enzyme
MRFLLTATTLTACLLTASAGAQLSAPNGRGVAMGHLHYVVPDVAAEREFWIGLGGEPGMFGESTQTVSFPDVVVFLREGENSGTSDGAVVGHVAFRVRSLVEIEERGYEVQRIEVPGVAYVYAPSGERIELFDDGLATNLWFETTSGETDPVSDRHNQPLDLPIRAHHIHLLVPEDQVATAQAWYVRHFGGVAGKRWRYDAADFPGINLNFSASEETLAPTEGRALDHIGFEIENLEAFAAELEAAGLKLDSPYRTLPSGFGLVFLTDPWGTRIELTEGLRDL